MTVGLDDRQRAMLAEMGVRIWWPAQTSPPQEAPATIAEAGPNPPETIKKIAEKDPVALGIGRKDLISAPADAPPAPAAPMGPDVGVVNGLDWPELETAVAACRACGLCERRRQTVFGVGDRQADWMVIGEAPGEQEDLRGEPFVGPAGQLLDNMLRAVGLSRTAGPADAPSAGGVAPPLSPAGVYIANVLKCRPPGNRNPQPDEMAHCAPYLRRQIALVQPRLILAMGRFAVQFLLDSTEPIGRLRGQVHRYEGIPVVVTYHPAYLLRNLPDKAKAWADLRLALKTLREASGG